MSKQISKVGEVGMFVAWDVFLKRTFPGHADHAMALF